MPTRFHNGFRCYRDIKIPQHLNRWEIRSYLERIMRRRRIDEADRRYVDLRSAAAEHLQDKQRQEESARRTAEAQRDFLQKSSVMLEADRARLAETERTVRNTPLHDSPPADVEEVMSSPEHAPSTATVPTHTEATAMDEDAPSTDGKTGGPEAAAPKNYSNPSNRRDNRDVTG